MAEGEVKKVVERLGLVSADDFENLKKRVQELEARLNG
jgi:tetrahydromethanopterin S-methyltransferase subunit G